MSRAAARALLAVCALASACGEARHRREAAASGDPVALLDQEAWSQVAAPDDALASHRPPTVECPEGAYGDEDGALEVQTGYCNYLALAQPLPTALAQGQALHVVLLHDRLVFDEPAEAHVAILLGDQVIWEKSLSIPAEPASYDETFTLERAAQQGDILMLHLHNHGYNTWKLLTLETASEGT